MSRPQRCDRELHELALQPRALRIWDVRWTFKHAEQGREARIVDRPCGRVAKPRLGPPGNGGLGRGVERANGRLGQRHGLLQGGLQTSPRPQERA